jgi:hypothetical protein
MSVRHPNHPGTLSTDAAEAERLRERAELSFRARAIEILMEAKVPFVVGGAYAYATYTGIYRDTKDLDLCPRKRDAQRALDLLALDGWRTERTSEVWLYKAFKGEWFVDLIFSSGNGVAEVDDEWFLHARPGVVFNHRVPIAPAEELIWSKAYVMERERFDGADVNHLIRAVGPELDWRRLLRRFGSHWEVLFSHLVLYRFSYPGERDAVPDWVMAELLSRQLRALKEGNARGRLCRGGLLSAVNYTVDTGSWGYQDGRLLDELSRKAGGLDAQGPELEAARGGGG